MATVVDKIARRIEDHYPHGIGMAAGTAMLIYGPRVIACATASGWQLDQLYGAIFNLSTVFTGFLFTFYTFVVTTDRGFLGKAKHSLYFKRANGFTILAIVAGFILCVLSVPMLVRPPAPTGPGLAFLSIWVAVAFWALLAFERATRVFIIFVSRHGASG
jgi:hypothetical protein